MRTSVMTHPAGVRGSVSALGGPASLDNAVAHSTWSRAADEGVAPAEIEALQAFLPAGRVHQTQLDALEMLRVMRERFAGPASPKQVRWHFEHTDAWEYLRSGAG